MNINSDSNLIWWYLKFITIHGPCPTNSPQLRTKPHPILKFLHLRGSCQTAPIVQLPSHEKEPRFGKITWINQVMEEVILKYANPGFKGQKRRSRDRKESKKKIQPQTSKFG